MRGERSEALSPTRKQILELLRDRPGLSTRSVARAVDLDASSADYHLRRLERAGVVVTERVGRVAAHYPRGWGDAEARVYAALSADARAVVATLRDWQRGSASFLARETGLRVQAVRHALTLAVRYGLARRARRGLFEVVA